MASTYVPLSTGGLATSPRAAIGSRAQRSFSALPKSLVTPGQVEDQKEETSDKEPEEALVTSKRRKKRVEKGEEETEGKKKNKATSEGHDHRGRTREVLSSSSTDITSTKRKAKSLKKPTGTDSEVAPKSPRRPERRENDTWQEQIQGLTPSLTLSILGSSSPDQSPFASPLPSPLSRSSCDTGTHSVRARLSASRSVSPVNSPRSRTEEEGILGTELFQTSGEARERKEKKERTEFSPDGRKDTNNEGTLDPIEERKKKPQSSRSTKDKSKRRSRREDRSKRLSAGRVKRDVAHSRSFSEGGEEEGDGDGEREGEREGGEGEGEGKGKGKREGEGKREGKGEREGEGEDGKGKEKGEREEGEGEREGEGEGQRDTGDSAAPSEATLPPAKEETEMSTKPEEREEDFRGDKESGVTVDAVKKTKSPGSLKESSKSRSKR
jgi:hypothetical protein